MQPLTFADRLTFAPARALRVATRRAVRSIALRGRAHRLLARRSCTAPGAGMDVPAAVSRVLRAPWEGGFQTIARGAGFDRIEPGCDARLAPTCFAPAIPAEANTTTATTTSTRNRRAPKRQLGHADSAIAIATNVPADDYAARLAATTAEVKPTVQLSDEQRARIEKEKAKLEKEERAAARRKARLEALERGEDPPTATKGLPPVVKMNELGALARQLHRAHLLALTDDARRLMGEGGASETELSATAYALRAGRALYNLRGEPAPERGANYIRRNRGKRS